MAGGATARSLKRSNPLGTSIGGFSPFERASTLHLVQNQEQRQDQELLSELMQDTGLSDNSSLENEISEPLLQLARQSYAANDNAIAPPFAGEDTKGGGLLGNSTDEIQRMRSLQEGQMQASRNFLGEIAPQNQNAQERQPTQQGATNTATSSRASTKIAGANGQSQENMASKLMQQQLADIRQKMQDQIRERVQKAVKDAVKKAVQQAAKKTAQGAIRVGTEGAQAIAAPEDFGVTLLTLWAQMNLQLFTKYILKNFLKAGLSFTSSMAGNAAGEDEMGSQAINAINAAGNNALEALPTQSFIEDFLTVFIDILLVILLVIGIIVQVTVLFGPAFFAAGMGYAGIQAITDLLK